MIKDKRKAARRPMRYTAWIALPDGQLQGCALSDISQSGAKIDVEKADPLPDRFVLLLSARGTPRRTCRVVWRTPQQMGVEFERRFSSPMPASPRNIAPGEKIEPTEAKPETEAAGA
jgi:hypothetical protein